MFRNYLRTALAGFRRQPGYVLLNILGLTLGIAATFFILLYISTELRYDRYHEKGERIYRISADITEPDDAFRWAVTQNPLGMQLKADYPEVEEFVRFIPNGRTQLIYNDNQFFDENVYLADSTLFDVFSLQLVQGDRVQPLHEPNSIALSTSLAARIFGSIDPIGKVLKTFEDDEYEVTALYQDFPTYAHLRPSALISSNTVPDLMNPSPRTWGGFGIYTYVLLQENADPLAFASKLPEVINNYVAVIFDQFNIKIKYELIPLFDIHLKSDFEGEAEPTGQMSFIYIFGAVALFMLLIASINYMNLATARATKRALEVGIRKVLGSDRKQLIAQFLSESLLLAFVAVVLSFLLVFLLLPLFNLAFGLNLERSQLFSAPLLLGALGVLIITGVLSGSYPAFYLSHFQPIQVLKSNLTKGAGNPNLRRILVTIQFAITLFMIIGTGVIYDQMNYLQNKELGFDKDHLMTFNLSGPEASDKYPVLRDRLLQQSKISAVSTATSSPGTGFGKQVMLVENASGIMDEYGVDNYGVDFDFFESLGIPIIAGRNFSREFGTDSTLAAVVNESMVNRMGWDDPIGKQIQFNGSDTLPMASVIGVVKDFHQQSFYEPIAALVFLPRFNNGSVHVRIEPESSTDVSQIIASVESTWQSIFPGTPFEFEFIDDAFMELYEADQARTKIFTLFSILMIFVACLGLLGLASFTAEQRTKEIGVRKILGANTTNIVFILTRNFALLVTVASIPAFIAAYFFMTKWLQTFSYHADLNFGLFFISLLIVLVIAVLTTGYHAVKAAIRNPVEALRHE